MKTRILLFFLIFMLILSACTPVQPQTGNMQDDQQAETIDGVDREPVGEALGNDGSNVTTDEGQSPPIEWNKDPEVLIVSGTYCCGFVMQYTAANYIPDFQIWGDGRIVWVVYETEKPGRQVLEGQLSEEQMRSILEKAAGAGFFGWDDRYANPLVADAADKCITINLTSVSKSVCEYYEGAPEAFHNLYDQLAQGTGIPGTDYVPKSGYLVAYGPARDLMRPISEDDVLWPADELFPLSDAEAGIWVEGKALELAWKAVNADPFAGTIAEASSFYNITLQIPGLSMEQPPNK